MTPEQLVKSISNLLFVAMVTVGLAFWNFLWRREHPGIEVFDVSLPAETVHLVLGIFLIIFNAVIFVFLWALYDADLSEEQVRAIKSMNVKFVLGPLLNPFYVSGHAFVNAVGYAFLIVLWWLGMHSFTYSLRFTTGRGLVFGWQLLVSCMYLILGLGSMVAIQQCWLKMGVDAYKLKWRWCFVGIPVGAFLPPLLLRLGIPQLFGR